MTIKEGSDLFHMLFGGLEKRIDNLEYYASLSLLEQDAINKQDSSTNISSSLQRFKNGIVVDSFKGHSVADITATEYKASIDVRKQELHPTFNIVFLDEFAFVPQNIATEFFNSVYPVISSGKKTKIIIVSTPNGMNLFYKLFEV